MYDVEKHRINAATSTCDAIFHRANYVTLTRAVQDRLTLVRSVCWRLVQGPVHWRSYLSKRGGCLSTPCTLCLPPCNRCR